MLNRLTITQKGLALITIPCCVQMVVAVVLFRGQAYRSEVENWAVHTKIVIVQAETLYRLLVESDSQVNAFVASGKERVGASFESLLSRLPEQMTKLRRSCRQSRRSPELMRSLQKPTA